MNWTKWTNGRRTDRPTERMKESLGNGIYQIIFYYSNQNKSKYMKLRFCRCSHLSFYTTRVIVYSRSLVRSSIRSMQLGAKWEEIEITRLNGRMQLIIVWKLYTQNDSSTKCKRCPTRVEIAITVISLCNMHRLFFSLVFDVTAKAAAAVHSGISINNQPTEFSLSASRHWVSIGMKWIDVNILIWLVCVAMHSTALHCIDKSDRISLFENLFNRQCTPAVQRGHRSINL